MEKCTCEINKTLTLRRGYLIVFCLNLFGLNSFEMIIFVELNYES